MSNACHIPVCIFSEIVPRIGNIKSKMKTYWHLCFPFDRIMCASGANNLQMQWVASFSPRPVGNVNVHSTPPPSLPS